MLNQNELQTLEPTHRTAHCRSCSNNCLLTISTFGKDPVTGRTRRFVTGNRCEKGAGIKTDNSKLPNLFKWKYDRLFKGSEDNPYIPLEPEEATRPTVGLPRVLNMYENYPFWFTFFKTLGFATILSDETTKSTYDAGIESMPSESVCYPAKLAHGHIMNLLGKTRQIPVGEHGFVEEPVIDFIWMPCIRLERQEDAGAQNHYNCPVVVSYPEVIKLNVDELASLNTAFLNPFVPYDDRERLAVRMHEELSRYWSSHINAKGFAPTLDEVKSAVDAAWLEDTHFKAAVHLKGEETLKWMDETGTHGIVLAGRPYHLDPEINHAIPELLNSFGLAVLTESSVSHLMKPERPLRIVDQWMFHSRLYAAAKYVTTRDDLDLIQLNSFGCGLDALTTDQTQEILEGSGKIYTVLKIDEVSNLGAARIRIRSLLAALHDQQRNAGNGASVNDSVEELRATSTERHSRAPERSEGGEARSAERNAGNLAAEQMPLREDATAFATRSSQTTPSAPLSRHTRHAESTAFPKSQYTQDMKDKKYTIIAPQMAPIHFELLVRIFQHAGYNLELLPSVDQGAVDAGLKYANNDICYPSILVTGQVMEAITSGRYDLDHTAVIITQTGGGCRATNYISLIRKALKEAGAEQVPVISLSFHRPAKQKNANATELQEDNPGFKISFDMLRRAIYAIYYGDLLMQCLYRTRPYEAEPGSAQKLFDWYMDVCKKQMDTKASYRIYKRTTREIIKAFDELPLINDRSKPRVGVVGEILVKFHPTANNQIVETIESEGCEVVVPGLTEFFLFGISGGIWQHDELSKPWTSKFGAKVGIWALDLIRKPLRKALRKSKRFEPPATIYELANYARPVLSLCNSMGEGWLLTAEMQELIASGCPNIVCTQPFGCLPNHVTGKGVIKELRRLYPESNIVAVDYDPGASEVNQLNRIKLMISVAKSNFEKAQDEPEPPEAQPTKAEPVKAEPVHTEAVQTPAKEGAVAEAA
jgi:predicted nucleotide-binding protein (sugar kinase/HSP70/actin superfamily)